MPEAGEVQQPQTHYGRSILIGSTVLLVVGFGVAYFLIVMQVPSRGGTTGGVGRLQPQTLQQLKKAGNYEAALAEYERIMSDPLKDANEKGFAVISGTNLKFTLTADIKDMIEDVQRLKEVVLDPSVETRVRVEALNTLSASVCRSGRDPIIFDELYKDEPFKRYLVPGDPDLSARLMAEWSYDMSPTSFAAIRIARWYSDQVFRNGTLSGEKVSEYTAEAEKYMEIAGQLVEKELKRSTDRTRSITYIAYRMWTAITVGRLATVKDEYRAQYKTEFEDLLNFLTANKNVGVFDYLYLVREHYARFMIRIDGNTAGAKAQLDILARELQEFPIPDSSTYVRLMRNESTYNPGGYLWNNYKTLMSISPSFKATVEELLIPDPETIGSSAAPLETAEF
ncbi:MAG: hypothetical protein HYS26_01150 [Candidatus Kaiserbacteria bacterium]|nr:MAG: hypothetical protein HYS26_01150 [Candidatus Kaiserbacteria bacterium]